MNKIHIFLLFFISLLFIYTRTTTQVQFIYVNNATTCNRHCSCESLMKSPIPKIFIYVYKIPKKLQCAVQMSDFYNLETAYRQSIESSPFHTKNANEADFFFIDGNIFCWFSTGGNKSWGADYLPPRTQTMHRVIEQLFSEIGVNYPFFNISGGSDHIMSFGWDFPAQRLINPRSYASRLFTQTVVIQNYALINPHAFNMYDPYRSIVGFPPLGEHDRHGEIMKRTCFDAHDIALCVNMKFRSHTISKRALMAYFSGSLANGYIRKMIVEQTKNTKDIIVEGRTPEYATKMLNSRFCLLVAGNQAWTRRLLDALLSGCIPVFLAPGIVLPYEPLLDWSMVSLRYEWSDILSGQWISSLRNISSQKIDEFSHNLVSFRRCVFATNSSSIAHDGLYTFVRLLALRQPMVVRGQSAFAVNANTIYSSSDLDFFITPRYV